MTVHSTEHVLHVILEMKNSSGHKKGPKWFSATRDKISFEVFHHNHNLFLSASSITALGAKVL